MKRNTPIKKKAEKHVCVCQSCDSLSTYKGMSEEMFYWVDREDHCSLHCIDCIEKDNLKIKKPYKVSTKKRGRPKKIDSV